MAMAGWCGVCSGSAWLLAMVSHSLGLEADLGVLNTPDGSVKA
jgi:hypothetical protein